MLIAGAKGHAKEILQIFEQQGYESPIAFFDNVSTDLSDYFYDRYQILKTESAAKQWFRHNSQFVLGLGNPRLRQQLEQLLTSWGGELATVCSTTASIGHNKVFLSDGLNIMTNVVIYNDTYIGRGTLLNTACSVHHDCIIGEYCEISPGARLLGRVIVGNYCRIGTNAVILPDVRIGHNVTIGAGTVVTRNVQDHTTVVGVPGRVVKVDFIEDSML